MNEQSQGVEVAGWTPREAPERVTLEGRYVTLKPLSEADFADLYAAVGGPENTPLWTWLPAEQPASLSAFWMWGAGHIESWPATYTIVPRGGRAAGIASLCNTNAAGGSTEIGWVLLGRALQRTREATEAFHLLQSYALDELGYRRLEWKCNSLNEPSRRAAVRLGFTYEGTFRQHLVVKGRNRDTDWFSIIDGEWPAIREGHERWLDPANFDADGRQRTPLGRTVER